MNVDPHATNFNTCRLSTSNKLPHMLSRPIGWQNCGDKMIDQVVWEIGDNHHHVASWVGGSPSSSSNLKYARVLWGFFWGLFFIFYFFLNLFKLFLGLLWQINCDILHLGYCCRISLFLLTANDTNCLPNTWIALEHLGRKQLAIMFLSWKSQ